MSRLIDADDLIVEILTHDLIGDDKEVDKIILDAPTVKAIPIEWLYQKRTLYLENECYMSLMAINEILNWWEKENEKDI